MILKVESNDIANININYFNHLLNVGCWNFLANTKNDHVRQLIYCQ